MPPPPSAPQYIIPPPPSAPPHEYSPKVI
jgi:hypothetical protein